MVSKDCPLQLQRGMMTMNPTVWGGEPLEKPLTARGTLKGVPATVQLPAESGSGLGHHHRVPVALCTQAIGARDSA